MAFRLEHQKRMYRENSISVRYTIDERNRRQGDRDICSCARVRTSVPSRASLARAAPPAASLPFCRFLHSLWPLVACIMNSLGSVKSFLSRTRVSRVSRSNKASKRTFASDASEVNLKPFKVCPASTVLWLWHRLGILCHQGCP